jgi:dTDP-4-amino-4,6-dideoxygalactose transaminase
LNIAAEIYTSFTNNNDNLGEKMKIPSMKPFFNENDIEEISDKIRSILRDGRLILGKYTNQFEQSFRQYCKVKHAIAVSSCTSALEITLRYFNIKGKSVIVPTNTFIATSNSVIYSGGTLVFADIEADTLCLDPADLINRITPETKGVIVVHIAGLPHPKIEEIQEICKKNKLFLIEDAAHAHGAKINEKITGSFGDAGCFSFYPTKPMTTCTGGMITTNDDNLAEYAISLRHHGVGRDLNNIVNLGYDWLMSEISALLGIYQLKALDDNIERKKEIARNYTNALVKLEEVQVLPIPANIRHSYYKYPVYLSHELDKQKLREVMKSDFGVDLGSVYDPPCHLHPVYKRLFGYHKGMFPIAENASERIFCLPMFPQMTEQEISHVIQSLRKALRSILALNSNSRSH